MFNTFFKDLFLTRKYTLALNSTPHISKSFIRLLQFSIQKDSDFFIFLHPKSKK